MTLDGECHILHAFPLQNDYCLETSRDNAWFSSLFTKHRPDIIEHFGAFGNTTIVRPIEKVRPIKMLHYVMNLKTNIFRSNWHMRVRYSSY